MHERQGRSWNRTDLPDIGPFEPCAAKGTGLGGRFRLSRHHLESALKLRAHAPKAGLRACHAAREVEQPEGEGRLMHPPSASLVFAGLRRGRNFRREPDKLLKLVLIEAWKNILLKGDHDGE